MSNATLVNTQITVPTPTEGQLLQQTFEGQINTYIQSLDTTLTNNCNSKVAADNTTANALSALTYYLESSYASNALPAEPGNQLVDNSSPDSLVSSVQNLLKSLTQQLQTNQIAQQMNGIVTDMGTLVSLASALSSDASASATAFNTAYDSAIAFSANVSMAYITAKFEDDDVPEETDEWQAVITNLTSSLETVLNNSQTNAQTIEDLAYQATELASDTALQNTNVTLANTQATTAQGNVTTVAGDYANLYSTASSNFSTAASTTTSTQTTAVTDSFASILADAAYSGQYTGDAYVRSATKRSAVTPPTQCGTPDDTGTPPGDDTGSKGNSGKGKGSSKSSKS